MPYAKELFAVNALGACPLVQLSHQPDKRKSILDERGGVLNVPSARRYNDDEFEDDDLYEDDELEDDDLYEDDLDEDDRDDDEFEDDEFEDDDLYDDDETDHPSFRKLFPIQEPDWWIGDPQRTELPRYYLN
jgi:hypothetical protein